MRTGIWRRFGGIERKKEVSITESVEVITSRMNRRAWSMVVSICQYRVICNLPEQRCLACWDSGNGIWMKRIVFYSSVVLKH